ncbi:MAG: IclR family transcriptional regulator [Beijerinckiaceae bacterium]
MAHDTIPQGKYVVPGLAQGLAVLALFSRTRVQLSAPQIARELDLPRTTVFRLLHTLQAMGFVRKEEDERYFRAGPAMLGSGFAYLASLDFVEVAQPILQRLRDRTGMSVHMAIRDGRDIVYVSRYAAHTTVRSSVTLGTRFPAHATIMGRMLLLDMNENDLRQLFPVEPLDTYSDKTPRTVRDLAVILGEDRKRGYAATLSYFERGVASVAAPIRESAGGIVSAINVTSVDAYVEPESMEGPIKDAVLEAAAEIERWISADTGVRAPRG